MNASAECPVCGLLQSPPELEEGEAAVCPRCGAEVVRRKRDSLSRTRAFALAGLCFYVPAYFFPLAEFHYHGVKSTVTLWGSVSQLFQHRQYGLSALVFFTSILTPAVKLVGLLLLSTMAGSGRLRLARTRLYQFIKFVDPWNMLEVFMLALVVGIAKFRIVADVEPASGAWLFSALVMATILAAESFDSRLIWDE